MADDGFLLLIDILRIDENRHNLRVTRRELRDASDPLSLPENVFKGNYRLSRQTAHDIIMEIGPHLNDSQRDEISIPKNLKILMTLHFYSQGSYQKSAGQDHIMPMSQTSVSRCIKEVTAVINDHLHYYVHFPVTDAERNTQKEDFMNMPNGFPGIIGAINCSHVAIIAPPTNHEEYPGIVFINRKNFYSLNVQIICNAELKILAINARYPGSVHDSAIWLTSAVKRHFTQNYNNGDRASWLIGDSGYPLEPWLMSPIFRENLTPAEVRYNNAHARTRNVIERVNGVLKNRFRCILKHRVLHYEPHTAAAIINACAILHNICVERNKIEIEEEYADNDNGAQGNAGPAGNIGNQNNINNWFPQDRLIRDRIIRDYFN